MFHLIDRLPTSAQPYAKLMRLHQPVGIWLLLWPCWWGIALASQGNILMDIILMAQFAVGAVVMRGAGCAINDIWDRKIDAAVARTKDRPLASGEISLRYALLFTGGLLLAGLVILLTLNKLSVILGFIIIIPVALYPLMKRLTFWPQAFLGFVFNWGALMGWAAVRGQLDVAPCLLYLAGIFWTLGYDTIYALQDKEDDALLGVKSTALLFGEKTKKWLMRFYASLLFFLVYAGIMGRLGNGFFVFVPLIGLHLFWQVASLDTESPENCRKRFLSNAWLGGMVFVAIVTGKILSF